MGIADIFRPAEQQPNGAILIFLGVAPAGPEDARVIRMGEALAKNNIVAMFYWSPTMFEKTLEVNDIDNYSFSFNSKNHLNFVSFNKISYGIEINNNFSLFLKLILFVPK